MSICTFLLKLLLSLCVFRNVCSSCVFQDGKYDLSSLDRSSGWPVAGPTINGTPSHYEISICRPLNHSSFENNGCINSSICLVSGNDAIKYGNAIENTSSYAIAANIGTGFSLYVLTQTLCKNKGIYRATINFACGPHLGAPELMLRSECQVNFFWRTSAACPTKPKRKQVPCYVLDDDGNKRDLSPLIKDNGGYLVTSQNPGAEFFINVCSDLVLNKTQYPCPQNTSACYKREDQHVVSTGSVFEGPKFTSEGLVLTYRGPPIDPFSSDYSFCHSHQSYAKTTIFFKCPVRGYSQPPRLISDQFCHFQIQWETEYACPENLLKGDIKTCQFSRKSHGVEIDLSPLRNTPVYNVFSPNTSTYFNISVCGGLENVKCGGKIWRSTSVCVYKNSSTTSQIGGTTDSAELLYADGQIMLKYLKGEACNGTEQMSVINFICDQNATNDGIGEPQHIDTKDCNHVFEWPTKYACLKEPLDTPCFVTYDKKTVNLENLLIAEGVPWIATHGSVDHENDDSSEYFINVCGPVSKFANLSMCGEASSICAYKDKGKFINLGNFTSSPEYDQKFNAVRLQYTGGSLCRENKYWQSTIIFKCKLGQINSKPVLTRIDETECFYEFEWQTADACPTGVIEGSNCKVFDSDLGIGFDLTSLKSKVYKVDSTSYEFYLGVCESVKDSPCSSNKDSQNVGVCQVDKTNHTSWKAGESTSHLSYADGVVNLTYLSGDTYKNVSRMSIIIFLCDYDAGQGHPIFVEEVDFAFVFHWYTDLVCPLAVSTECVVRDPSTQLVFDLSGLSMFSNNWKRIINEDGKERIIYLNVCRSLNMPVGCDPSAAACIVEKDEHNEDKVVVSNLGRALTPPVLQSLGHISLTYTNGDKCTSYGENTTYSTLINFLCIEEDSFETGFRYLGKVGNCEYSFLWATKAACPSGKVQSVESCMVTDPNSGFTFDLTSLNSLQPYSVMSPSGQNFQFNICGRVVNGCYASNKNEQPLNISICETDNDGISKKNIAISDGYTLSYMSGEELALIYKTVSGSSIKEVVIKFPCFNSTDKPNAKFVSNDSQQYILEIKTSLTCIPQYFIDCNVIDEFGQEYDLSSLAKYNDGNWDVIDSRSGYSHLRYHINFCRPLNQSPLYKCPGGLSSACQTSLKDEKALGLDLGTQNDKPFVSNTGVVVVHYTGGSPCPNSQLKTSTFINLYCAKKTGVLKFIDKTAECEYVFSLDTPSACPLETSHGENCFVREPLYGYMFNLNPLKNKNSNYNVSVGEYIYNFNVCDKLNGFSNKCSDSAACQLKPKDPNFSKSLGLPNNKLVYRKGLISLEYKSGSGNCHGKYNRTTKITFTCHHAHEIKDGPIFISEAQDCTYLFEWPTVHACPSFDVIECSVFDENGNFYDLSRLSLPNENYYVKHPYSNKTFAINVCRSVVHTPNSLCPYTSAACLVDSSSKVDPINMGVVSQSPYFESGKIKIRYPNGEPCHEGPDQSARFYQTEIEFVCDPSLFESEPYFLGRDGCNYYFDWRTVYACPPRKIENHGSCTVSDPITGYLFNLTSLKHHGPFKVQKGDHQYHLSFCGSGSNPCGDSAGMCQEEVSGEKRHWNAGLLNSNLTYENGVLLLNYSGGDSCHGGLYKRNTIIEIHCGPDLGEPKFLYESYDCNYFFVWKTELACQTLVHCAIKNGSVYYDLTSFTQSHYVASSSVLNDNASYLISVCNSLGEIPEVTCPPGAAICRISDDVKTGGKVAESLGKVEHPPFVDFMGHATAIFTNGSTCLRNSKYQNRARIIFLCEADAGMGEPVLVDYSDDCLFLFEWRTNIVCPEKPEEVTLFTSCNYTDNSRGIHFDLSALKKTGTHPYYEVSNGSDSVFRLNICSSKLEADGTKCNNSAGVCGQSGSVAYNYGLATSQKFRYNNGRLSLNFYDGDDCPSGMNGKRTAEVIFVCDPTAGMGEPRISKIYTCLVIFNWKTSLVCMNTLHQCAFDISGQHYDFNLLSSLSHNWVTSDSRNSTYWINICRGIQPTLDTFGCSPTSVVCMSDRNGSHSSLGLVQNMKIKAINSSNLLMTFENGDSSACPPSKSLTPLHAVTRLFMRCGRSLGRPRIFSGPDDKCYFDFVWETILACADKTEEVMIEKDGIIKDSRLNFSFDISDILHKTYSVPGNHTDERYIYKINLSGVARNSTEFGPNCGKAAVCQTKPKFERDIGTFDTRTFIVRGSELHLVFQSTTKACGKNRRKNVTTLINMQCSSAAGFGSPEFIYESGDCDYIFEWPTIVVCPDYHRWPNNSSDPNAYISDTISQPSDTTSHHRTEVAVGIIFGIIAAMIVVFIVVKAERRAIISSRFRNLFNRANLPYFRYKRCGGERLVLVDASQTVYDDEDMLHC